MKTLVTGGAGFIGSHLVDELIDNGHTVIIVDDLSGSNGEYLSPYARFIQADCRDEKEMDRIFKTHTPEVVFHLAANAAENKAQFSPIDVTSRNYDAFIKVLTPFIKYGGKRFVYTSSVAVYGSLQIPFKETDIPQPEDLYGINKLAAEQTLAVMSKVHGFEYVITRPHNVYGPRQYMQDPYRNVVTIWMNNALRNEPITVYGDGTMKRCFSYIKDVVAPLCRCGFEEVTGMTFNIGSDLVYQISELADAIDTNVKLTRTYLPKREQEVQDAVSDHTLLREKLGYHETSLHEGIRKTWLWAKEKGAQEPIYTEIEIQSKKLPKNWK